MTIMPLKLCSIFIKNIELTDFVFKNFFMWMYQLYYLSLWDKYSTIRGITPALMMSSIGGFLSLERSFRAAWVACIWRAESFPLIPEIISGKLNDGPTFCYNKIMNKRKQSTLQQILKSEYRHIFSRAVYCQLGSDLIQTMIHHSPKQTYVPVLSINFFVFFFFF